MNQTFNNLLTRAQLKDKAKEALTGKFGKFILALFIITTIKIAFTLVLELIAILLYSMFIVINECVLKGLTLDELETLINNMASMQPYLNWFTLIDYVVVNLALIFCNVFTVGTALFSLNLACGRPVRTTDIFYGFRYQFGKAIKLSALFVLIGQIVDIPNAITSFLIDIDAAMAPKVIMLVLSVIGLIIHLPISYMISQSYYLMLDFPNYSVGQLIKTSCHIMKGHKFRLFLLELSFLPLLLLAVLSFGIGAFWVVPYKQVTHALFFLNLMQARSSAPETTQENQNDCKTD